MSKTKLFFASDIHGSERCLRKFLNAGKFYEANVVILGGDITGKMIVSLVRQADGTCTCDYGGTGHILKSQQEIDELVRDIRDSGYYPYFAEPKEIDELSEKPELVKLLFKRVVKESVAEWMRLAEQKLRGTDIKCYISPGNDDAFEIDEILSSAACVINPEEKIVDIDSEHQMITLGYSNRTPWNSPREIDEDDFADKIDKLAIQIKDMRSAIFNIHVPPIDSGLDEAPKLDETLKPVVSGGTIVMAPAGSISVRKSIEKYQPLIGLHGHIHESRGARRIGRTMCFNPGTEYNAGVLRGLLCDLGKDTIESYSFTSG